MKRAFSQIFGTFFGVGHIPVVPATWTSLVVALLFLLIPIDSVPIQLAFVALSMLIGVPACTGLEREYGEDPKQATMDEAAGMAITLVGVPLTPLNVLIGFVLFRIFDVVKPPPARQMESLHGGWGIMLDDAFAGFYARGTLAVILWLMTRVA